MNAERVERYRNESVSFLRPTGDGPFVARLKEQQQAEEKIDREQQGRGHVAMAGDEAVELCRFECDDKGYGEPEPVAVLSFKLSQTKLKWMCLILI